MTCELCGRDVDRLTVHHLIPRQNTKRKKMKPGPTITICPACHRQIHALFPNSRLALELNTCEALRNDPQMQKFLAWVTKQKPDKRVRVYRS